jgi:hypothetical protein
VVHQPQRLVVQVFVGVALFGKVVEQPRIAPDRPVMLCEHDIRFGGEAVARLV